MSKLLNLVRGDYPPKTSTKWVPIQRLTLGTTRPIEFTDSNSTGPHRWRSSHPTGLNLNLKEPRGCRLPFGFPHEIQAGGSSPILLIIYPAQLLGHRLSIYQMLLELIRFINLFTTETNLFHHAARTMVWLLHGDVIVLETSINPLRASLIHQRPSQSYTLWFFTLHKSPPNPETSRPSSNLIRNL